MKSLRIAFLTPEYVTELKSAGGLASYLSRMAQALRRMGHRPEIFTLSESEGTVEHDGIPVHRVRSVASRIVLKRGFGRAYRIITAHAPTACGHLRGAWSLARALRTVEREAPFDLVQSSDFGFAGLFVQRLDRPHVVRCSWAGELFMGVDDAYSASDLRWTSRLERRSIRRADRVYAPSRFVADYYRSRHGIEMEVIRPPAVPPKFNPGQPLSMAVPSRYLIHFGQIGARKGSDVIARALPRVWAEEPDFTMVWAGVQVHQGLVEEYAGLWNERKSQVHYLGPVQRDQLYALIAAADAAVLPSSVDNLPNTVIESLMLGIPVIGSAGASIDELVEDGRSGTLVPVGDDQALASAMIGAWRKQLPWSQQGFQAPAILDEMQPERAGNLLKFAGLVDEKP